MKPGCVTQGQDISDGLFRSGVSFGFVVALEPSLLRTVMLICGIVYALIVAVDVAIDVEIAVAGWRKRRSGGRI